MSDRHQRLVRADNICREEASLRTEAAAVLNEEPMDLDQTFPELDLEEHQDLTKDDLRQNESETFEDPEEAVPSIFEEEDSDDEEGKLVWTDMIDVAVGQISAEPQDDIFAATSPLFQREEAKIEKLAPDNSTWYPFLNKEVRIQPEKQIGKKEILTPLIAFIVPCWISFDWIPSQAHIT
jgi:hypothetical protein